MKDINILSVQMHCEVGNKKANLEKAKYLIEKNSDSNPDLIILPEFFTTGIGYDVFSKFSEEEHSSETLEFFKDLAQKYNSNIVCGTIIEREKDKLYNTSYMLNRHGEKIAKYRKIHLFDYFGGQEGTVLSSGDETVVVSSDIGKIGLSICFDIKFPLHARELMKKGAEIIVSPSAWFSPIKEEWRALNIVRASENALFFVSSNQCGMSEKFPIPACGNTMLVNPSGEIVSCLGDEEGCIVSKINLSQVAQIRKEFPVMSL